MFAALADARVHDLPPGFTKVSGKRGPRDGLWHIMLRCGAIDERIAYSPEQLCWKHGGHAGDIVAAKRAD